MYFNFCFLLLVKNYNFLNRIQCHLSPVNSNYTNTFTYYTFNNNLVENTNMFFHDYLNFWNFF